MIALILVAALLTAPTPPAPPIGLPGPDGVGSVRIEWTQHSDATRVSVAVLRADGTQQNLTSFEAKPPPMYGVPETFKDQVLRVYARTWQPGDRLIISEQRRVWNVQYWTKVHGPFDVRWRAWLPVVVQAQKSEVLAAFPRPDQHLARTSQR